MTELPVVSNTSSSASFIKKPDWLRVKLPIGENYKHVRHLVDHHKLHTICESGNCPNMGECWGAGTATFMILGNVCTRSCGFCSVATGRPGAVDWDEPQRVAEAIQLMKVKHAVITSVDRDELPDGGSTIWFNTIRAVKTLTPDTTLETLIPDFKGKKEDINRIAQAHPEVVSHNIETVERLTRQVRIQAKYWRSMEVIRTLKEAGMRTKSGIMLGLGRALGETMAVTFVIGNTNFLNSASLFDPGNSITSALANEFAEAGQGLHTAALIELGLILFLITFVILAMSKLLLLRLSSGEGSKT